MITLWNKLKGTGGSGGGGSASFPTVVTDSGSSLPVDLTGYNEGDTFLNTTDKKIYTAVPDGYMDNTNTTINCDINYSTGVASNFASGQGGKYARRSSLSGLWVESGVQKYTVKFKVTALSAMPIFYLLGTKSEGNYSRYYIGFGIGSDNKIYQTIFSYETGTYTKLSETKILDTEIVANSDYVLNITKDGTNCIAQLVKDGEIVEKKSFETENLTTGTGIGYGFGYIGTGIEYATDMEIYLLDSSGELLVPNTDVTWNSGTDLTDKTEYADKTNGILYLYEDSELIEIDSAKPTVVTDGDNTGLAVAENTIYKWANAITSLTISSFETSDLESVLYFTTGAGTISLSAPNTLRWGGGNEQPTLEPNTVYCIAIRNGLAEIDSFGSAS